MATSVTVNPPPTSATSQPMQLYMMPGQHVKPARIVRPVPGMRCLSIAMVVVGGILIALGIAAMVLRAYMSNIANPIWTGLLFVETTGILGIFVYKTKNNFCVNIAFLVMTIISACFSYLLMQTAFTFAYLEPGRLNLGRWGSWYCSPGPADNNDYWGAQCSPKRARLAVDFLIGFGALAALVLCILSFSMTMYGTFACCYNCCASSCCRKPSASSTVQSSSDTSVIKAPMTDHAKQVPPVMAVQGIPEQPGASHHQYPQIAPPAYMPTAQPIGSTPPQAFMVTNDQQMSSVPVVVPFLNLAPTSGGSPAPVANENTQQIAAGSTSPAPAPATAESV